MSRTPALHVVPAPTAPAAPQAAPAPRRSRRKPKAALWPSPGPWPAPEPLRSIPWGSPDPVLGAMVCRSLERSMPPTPWVWTPTRTSTVLHSRLGSALGWTLVATVVLCTLAGLRS